MIIDEKSVSFDEIRRDILEYALSLPDSARWKDFYDSSAGQTLIELIAGLAAFIKYEALISRRENYIQYATTKSSVIAAAQSLGYSAKRGLPPRIKLKFIPNISGLQEKFTVIGKVKDKYLVLVDSYVLNANVQTEVECYVSSVKEEQIQISKNTAGSFVFKNRRVSDEYMLFLNDVQVPTSEKILDLVNKKFVVQTNGFGSVTVSYLNLSTFTVRYKVSDILKLRYVETGDIDFNEDNIELFYGKFVEYSYVHRYISEENEDEIRIRAPLSHETNYVIRAREDYKKLLLLSSARLSDVSSTDISPAVVGISYICNDYSLLSHVDKQQILQKMDSARPMGIMPPKFIDPEIYFINVGISIKVRKSETNAVGIIKNIINEYNKSFKSYLNVYDIENRLESLDFIKIARVEFKAQQWQPVKYYRKGALIAGQNAFYLCEKRLFLTGATEPLWNLAHNEATVDGDYIWLARYKADETIEYPKWQARKEYNIGDIVDSNFTTGNYRRYCFVCHKVRAYSKNDVLAEQATGTYQGVTFRAVTAGSIGNAIRLQFDGLRTCFQIVENWNTLHPNNRVEQVTGSPALVLAAGELQLSGGIDYVSGEPTWDNSPYVAENPMFFDDAEVLWLKVPRVGTPQAWQPNTIYNKGDVVKPRQDAGFESIMFQCVGYNARSGTTMPAWNNEIDASLVDGTCLWRTVNSNFTSFSKKFNEYFYFTPTIEIE